MHRCPLGRPALQAHQRAPRLSIVFYALGALAAATVAGPASAIDDHLQCFKIKDKLKLHGNVDMDSSQFGLDPRCEIKPGKLFCVPAEKTNVSVQDGKAPLSPLPYSAEAAPGDRICYRAACPFDKQLGLPKQLEVTDQFGTRTVSFGRTKSKTQLICTPANKGSTFCGDGSIADGEVCDGDNLGDQTCETQGFGLGGTLACAPGCMSFDTSGCRGAGSGLTSDALWSVLVCEIFEDIPNIYPDTQTCYLLKEIEARTDVAYKIEMDLPWTTYSSTATYEDTKPVAWLKDSEYIVRDVNGNQVPNPYQPGNVVNTPRTQRKVTIHATPDYDGCIAQGKDNCILINSNPQFPRNLIFQRVYYPNRRDPETDEAFRAEVDYDRMGYTRPGKITCVMPSALDLKRPCPRFPVLSDLPFLNLNIGRTPTPDLVKQHPECPNRQAWYRPQLFWTHWAGPGALGPGGPAPDPATTCTGYLLTLLYPLAVDQHTGEARTEPTHMVFITYIRTPPTFFDVSRLTAESTLPDPAPDVRYIGIQNYGTEFADVRYNEQSAAVNEIPTWPDNKGQGNGEGWVFLHFSRPALHSDESTIRNWARINNVKAQQLAIYDPTKDRHPPFLIYRNKETSPAFQETSAYIRSSVPCYSWTDPDDPTGPKRPIDGAPLTNAASATYADGTSIMMGTSVPVTVACEYTPGQLTEDQLSDCLWKTVMTNPSWYNPDGSLTCDPNL
jgi:hypothetical protein